MTLNARFIGGILPVLLVGLVARSTVETAVRGFGHSVRTPLSFRADAFMRFDAMRDWGPFVRMEGGSDPYNVRFDASVLVIGAGMMWEP